MLARNRQAAPRSRGHAVRALQTIAKAAKLAFSRKVT